MVWKDGSQENEDIGIFWGLLVFNKLITVAIKESEEEMEDFKEMVVIYEVRW